MRLKTSAMTQKQTLAASEGRDPAAHLLSARNGRLLHARVADKNGNILECVTSNDAVAVPERTLQRVPRALIDLHANVRIAQALEAPGALGGRDVGVIRAEKGK